MTMRKSFLHLILIGFAMMAGTNVFTATEVPPLNLKLQPVFESQFQCSWKPKSTLKFWVGPLKDVRQEKEVGRILTKQEETPIVAARPIAQVLKEGIQMGLKKCGYTEAATQERANIWLTGRLEDFSGSSKKGFLKGRVQGRAEFTLNLQQSEPSETLSVSFVLEEALGKGGVSKSPKKLEKVLNSLLTRLTLEIFQSKRVAEWITKVSDTYVP